MKLKPDWVKFARIGIQLFTCSQAEQEQRNDESLRGRSLRIKMGFQSIILKIAEDMCSVPQRMTRTDCRLISSSSGRALALRTRLQSSGVHLNVMSELVDLSDSAVASAELSGNDQEVTLMSRFDSDPPAPPVESLPTHFGG